MKSLILNISIYLVSCMITILFVLAILWLIEGMYIIFSYVYISVCLIVPFIFAAIKLYKENFK